MRIFHRQKKNHEAVARRDRSDEAGQGADLLRCSAGEDARNHFTIIETWQDRRAYGVHVGSDHTVKLRQDIQPFLDSPFGSGISQKFR